MTFSRLNTPRVGRSSCVVVRAASTALPAKFSAVRPTGERVLVKLAASEQQSLGGILLPSAAVAKKTEGTVAAVGKCEKTNLKVGDEIVYARFAGTELTIGNDEHVIMREDDVIGIKGAKVKDMTMLQDRILIELSEEDTQSAGGVLLTTQSTDRPTIGTVVAVGPGKVPEDPAKSDKVPVNVSVGSEVLYSKYSGIELEDDGVKFVVVREEEIMAVLS